MRKRWHRTMGVLGVSLGVLIALAPSAAAAPSNDSESRALEVTSLPFTHEEDTTGADANGPRFCSNNTSVFFRLTPSDTVQVQADTIGSDYDTVLSVYTRDGGVHEKGCSDDQFGLQSAVRFRAKAGVTYYFLVAQCCGSGSDFGGGDLVFTVSRVSRKPLDATLEVSASGTVDPATGLATISGTATCTARSEVDIEGQLRELRQGLFVARGYVFAPISCVPGDPVEWSVDVDTETGVAFGEGSARMTYSAWAWDGFEGYVELAVGEVLTITLTNP